MRLVLIGPPGSGKGTQGERLAGYLQIPHITTGGMIREEIAEGTPLGRRFDEVIARGDFLPDEDMIPLVERRLARQDAFTGFVLDGFPRDLAQADKFSKTPVGRALDAVVALSLPDEQIIRRLSGRWVCPVCGKSYQEKLDPPRHDTVCDLDSAPLSRRPDDAPEAVRHRIEVYKEVTAPVIDYYKQRGLVREVDAAGDPDAVFDEILGALGAAGRPKSVPDRV